MYVRKLILLIAITLPVISAHGLTQGDYHQRVWAGGTHIWLNYPEDAKPGESININVHVVSGLYSRGNVIGEINIKVSVLTSSTSMVLYDNSILSNTYLNLGDSRDIAIPITLPSDARWYMTIQVDAISYETDMNNRKEAHVALGATQIRANTYSSLEQQVQELQAYNNQQAQKYNELLAQLNSLSTTPDTQLQQQYLELLEDYITLTTQYNQQILVNQTGEVNQDLLNNIMMLESKVQELSTQLDEVHDIRAELNEKEAIVLELKNTKNRLVEENQDLLTEVHSLNEEKNSLEAEYMEYQATNQVNQEKLDGLESDIRSAYTLRNILAITTILGLTSSSYLYFRKSA